MGPAGRNWLEEKLATTAAELSESASDEDASVKPFLIAPAPQAGTGQGALKGVCVPLFLPGFQERQGSCQDREAGRPCGRLVPSQPLLPAPNRGSAVRSHEPWKRDLSFLCLTFLILK